jgi:hypothetical protein
MATAIINGRRTEIPSTATDEEVRQMGAISPERTLIKREREGNFVIPRGSRVDVKDGDVFVDAPRRIKG